jgi:hypothetical protein
MLLGADDLLEHLEQLARRQGGRMSIDRAWVDAALVEAAQLAGTRAQDEPAAIFFAFARRSRAFGMAAESFVPAVARAQAIAVGTKLVMEDMELRLLRAGVLRGELRFDDLRVWFADCLRPLEHRPV